MCLKTIDYFDGCDHNTNNSATVAAFCEVQKCPDWDDMNQTCTRLRTQDHHQNGKCPDCNPGAIRERCWYKHCNQSRVCDHEYDHMITDAERDPEDEDTVLVSPQYGLCPECTRGGYDQRPGGNNPPPKTPSRMPTDFEDLPREDYSKFESVSKIPSSSLRPVSPSNASQSRLSSNVYNPGASRVPPPKRPAYASEAGSNFSTQPSQISRESPWSSQSQISNTSQQLSQRPPTTSSSIKPTTATQHPISKIGDPKVSSIAPYPYARTKAPPANEEGPDLDVLLNTPTVMPPSRHSNLSPPGGTAYRAASSSPPSSPSSKQAQQPPHSKRADVARSSASSPSLAQSKAQFPSSLSETPRNSKILPLASSRLQKKNRSKYPPFI